MPKMCTLFCQVDIKKCSFLTACVFWFISWTLYSCHLCFRFNESQSHVFVQVDVNSVQFSWIWLNQFSSVPGQFSSVQESISVIVCTEPTVAFEFYCSLIWPWDSSVTESVIPASLEPPPLPPHFFLSFLLLCLASLRRHSYLDWGSKTLLVTKMIVSVKTIQHFASKSEKEWKIPQMHLFSGKVY